MNQSDFNHKKFRTTVVSRPEELFFHALYDFPAQWYFGRPTARVSRAIKDITDINVRNFRLILTEQYLKHFYNRHYQERIKGQRSLTFKDVERLNDTVNKFYEIRKGKRGKTIVLKTRFPDGTAVLIMEIFPNRKVLSGRSLRIETS